MSPTLYFSPNEYRDFKSINPARRAFARAAVQQEQVVLVREDGMNFEVTINDVRSNMVTKKLFGNKRQVDDAIKEAFPCYLA